MTAIFPSRPLSCLMSRRLPAFLFCTLLAFILVFPFQAEVAASSPEVIQPAPGNPLRKAVLDGLRRDIFEKHQLQVVFVVNNLRVLDNWAWVATRPQSPDGNNKYEDVTALLNKQKGQWEVISYPFATDGSQDELDWFALVKQCRKNNPQVPAALFPDSGWQEYSNQETGFTISYPPGWDVKRESNIVSAGPAAERQKLDKTTRLRLTQQGNTTPNDVIWINPIRNYGMLKGMGTCYCNTGSVFCTYSDKKDILYLLPIISESLRPGSTPDTTCN